LDQEVGWGGLMNGPVAISIGLNVIQVRTLKIMRAASEARPRQAESLRHKKRAIPEGMAL
jgi:hypothetical protein